MKKIPAWLIVLLILGLLIGSKFIFFGKKEEKISPSGSAKKSEVAVNYFVVRPVAFTNDVFATGRIGALNQVEIIPEVGGKVVSINFKEGESVQKGDLLVKLSDMD